MKKLYTLYGKKDEYYDYSQLQFLGKKIILFYYFDPKIKLFFEQNLLIHDKPNTKPLAISETNLNPFLTMKMALLFTKQK